MADERLDDFKLEPISGDAKELEANDLEGKVVLLNFWGTWCPPCRQEFPHVVEIWRQYRNTADCKVLAVSCGGASEVPEQLKEETLAFLSERQTGDFPTYSDLERRTRHAVQRAVGFDGYPMTLVLDRTGKIRGTWVGYHAGSELEMVSVIEQCLKEDATN